MHQGLLRQGLLTLPVCHANPTGRVFVIMRCASVVFAQGAAKNLLTFSVSHASPAGCMIVIMRCASVLHAQGAVCTKACFGKAF